MRRHGFSICSNKPHTHTHTSSHATRSNKSGCCLLPIHQASSSPLLLDPPPTPIPTIPPPLHHRHKHLRLLMGCLLLCASKRLFVRGERRILAPLKDAFLCSILSKLGSEPRSSKELTLRGRATCGGSSWRRVEIQVDSLHAHV